MKKLIINLIIALLLITFFSEAKAQRVVANNTPAPPLPAFVVTEYNKLAGKWEFESIISGEKLATELIIEAIPSNRQGKFRTKFTSPTNEFDDRTLGVNINDYFELSHQTVDGDSKKFAFAKGDLGKLILYDKGKVTSSTFAGFAIMPDYSPDGSIYSISLVTYYQTYSKTSSGAKIGYDINKFRRPQSTVKLMDIKLAPQQSVKYEGKPILEKYFKIEGTKPRKLIVMERPRALDILYDIDQNFLTGTKYRIEFLNINNVKGDSDDSEKESELLGDITYVIKDKNNKIIVPEKEIFSHSSAFGTPKNLNKNAPLALNHSIDFNVPEGEFSSCTLELKGQLSEMHRTKTAVGGEFPRIQGFYLKRPIAAKTEEFSFASAVKGENNIEIDLRLEREGDGQNTTVGVKVRITKVN